MGHLALTLTLGRGVLIGRRPLRVRCTRIAPRAVEVTCTEGKDLLFELPLTVGATLKLGDDMALTLVRVREGDRGLEARVSFRAPANVAISRDSFSLKEHMVFQRNREVAA